MFVRWVIGVFIVVLFIWFWFCWKVIFRSDIVRFFINVYFVLWFLRLLVVLWIIVLFSILFSFIDFFSLFISVFVKWFLIRRGIFSSIFIRMLVRCRWVFLSVLSVYFCLCRSWSWCNMLRVFMVFFEMWMSC